MASELIEIEDARARVLAAVERLPAESVPLARAPGRILAEAVTASVSLPGFDNSAMDGYAVRAEDLARAAVDSPAALRIVGESRAGHPAQAVVGPGEAIGISTGAMIPAGADAVVRIEDTTRADGEVRVTAAVPAGSNIRREGEDVGRGEEILGAGAIVGAAEVGALAAVGRAEARCARRPRVALVSTGDELTSPGEELRPGAIYNSNAIAVEVLAAAAGAETVSVAVTGDDAASTRETLGAALAGADVLVVCGGVSVGAHDHVRPALGALGAEQSFWGVSLRPGKPTYFGTVERAGGRRLIFGLPGNPVSALVTFLLFVRPALLATQGAAADVSRVSARMASDYETARGRGEAIRVRLDADDRGWLATPTGPQGSHVLTSMIGADGLAIAPTETEVLRAGDPVPVELLDMGRTRPGEAMTDGGVASGR